MNNNTHQVAIKKLADKDKKIKNAIIKYGMPNDRITKGGFETLFKMIVGQQISVKAANSVFEGCYQEAIVTIRFRSCSQLV